MTETIRTGSVRNFDGENEPPVMPRVEVGEYSRLDGRQRFVSVSLGGETYALAPYKARELGHALIEQADELVRRKP